MEYPQKLYVAVRERDWPSEDDGESSYYYASPNVESCGEYHKDTEAAVYELVGKIRLVNKTVIAEPDA